MSQARALQRRRLEAFRRFVANNPPRMPADFSHRDWKRVVGYAKSAFCGGYNTGRNDLLHPERIADNKRPRRARAKA